MEEKKRRISNKNALLCYADESMTWWQETVLITVEDEKLIIREGHFLE